MNPLVMSALKYASPYIAASCIGAFVAWNIQGVRIESANNKAEQAKVALERYIAESALAQQEAAEFAMKQRIHSGEIYAKLQADLESSISRNDVYRRCISAGKCNGMRVSADLCQTGTVQAAAGTDATGSDTIPSAGIDAAVVNDCAKTTLQINQLQSDIKQQRGY